MDLLGKSNSVDKDKPSAALLTNLSIAFNCLHHELLTARLNAYGFSVSKLRLTHNCLSNRKPRAKIDENYSSWSEISFCIQQGPIRFNIFLVVLFFVVKDRYVEIYARNNTPFIVKTFQNLKQASEALFDWFKNNSLKNNIDKCQVLFRTNKPVGNKIGDFAIDNSECKKLLGVKIDVNLNFNNLLSNLCKKASRKTYALPRVYPFMELSKIKLLINAFFTSQFSCCYLRGCTIVVVIIGKEKCSMKNA